MLSSRLGHRRANTDCAPVTTGSGALFLTGSAGGLSLRVAGRQDLGILVVPRRVGLSCRLGESIANCAPLD